MRPRRILISLFPNYKHVFARPTKLEGVLEKKFGNNRSFTFAQIGANDGISFDNLHTIVTRRNCSGIVVEPVVDYFESLQRAYSDHPKIEAINLGVHTTEKSATIYRVVGGKADSLPDWARGIASLDPNHHKELDIPSEVIVAEKIECIHLMDLLEQHSLMNLDLLQIDVEGYDAEVIRMLDFTRIKPTIIKYEHTSLSVDDLTDINENLKKNGYELYADGGDTIAVLAC